MNEIIAAYREGHTSYPKANGMDVLRAEVARTIGRMQGLAYDKNEVLLASGGRPLIYAAFRTIVDRGGKVVFPIPSWNNDHCTFLTGAQRHEPWFRISAGTLRMGEVPMIFENLRKALALVG